MNLYTREKVITNWLREIYESKPINKLKERYCLDRLREIDQEENEAIEIIAGKFTNQLLGG